MMERVTIVRAERRGRGRAREGFSKEVGRRPSIDQRRSQSRGLRQATQDSVGASAAAFQTAQMSRRPWKNRRFSTVFGRFCSRNATLDRFPSKLLRVGSGAAAVVRRTRLPRIRPCCAPFGSRDGSSASFPFPVTAAAAAIIRMKPD